MKKIYSLFVALMVLLLASGGLYAQQSIGGVTPTRPHYYSVLELISQYKSGVYGGLRLPQMTTSQRDGLGIPALTGGAKDSAQGLTIFNTTINCVEYWNNTQWTSLCGISSTNIVQIIKDSTSNWYSGNTVLQDSIIQTVKAKADSLTTTKFLTVNGTHHLDSTVLKAAKLDLDAQALANDSLFIATEVSNKQFKDSVANIVINSPVVNNDITKVVKDSTTQWYSGNTTLRDSIINTVTANAKTATSPKSTVTLGNNTNSVLNNLTVDVKPGGNNTVMTTDNSGNITWAPAANYVDTAMLAGTNITINRSASGNTINAKDTAMLAGTNITINRSASGNTISATDTAMLAGSNITITRSASGNTINATVAGTASVTSPNATINVTGTNTVLGATTVDIKPGANNTVLTTNSSGAVTWSAPTDITGNVSQVVEGIGSTQVNLAATTTGIIVPTITLNLTRVSTVLVTYSACPLPQNQNAPVQGSIDLIMDGTKAISSYYSAMDAPTDLVRLGNYSTTQKVITGLTVGSHTFTLQAKSWHNPTMFNVNPVSAGYAGAVPLDAQAMTSRITIIVFNQ